MDTEALNFYDFSSDIDGESCQEVCSSYSSSCSEFSDSDDTGSEKLRTN